jgi:hypothetical protein
MFDRQTEQSKTTKKRREREREREESFKTTTSPEVKTFRFETKLKRFESTTRLSRGRLPVIFDASA